MSQPRLNAVSLCHVHQDIMDSIDIRKLAKNLLASQTSAEDYLEIGRKQNFLTSIGLLTIAVCRTLGRLGQ